MSKKANAIQKTNKMMMEDHRMRDYEAVKTKLGEAGEDAEFLELIFQACQYCYMMEMLEGDHVIPFKEWLTDDVMETVMEAFMVCAAYRETENETIFDEAFKEYDFESEEDCMKLLEALEEDNGGQGIQRCPRCGRNELPKKKSKRIYSKYANVPICPDCKSNEKFRIRTGRKPLPFTDWDFIKYISGMVSKKTA